MDWNYGAAMKMFPEDIISGNIDPGFLLTGSPQQVYEHCRKMIEVGRKLSGGFILAPGCDISPHTPDANLDSMRQAINDFGVYEH
ncbi:uroporphyrinogen decarboxylase family protein [Desulfococcaceae bacterium HSG7]|nr:uroporphyrinogen decarboxylase family protein [Desulfococcaceae bacterium HSG7]